ncbi:MAG: HIT family protein [Bacteroidales bacterium]|jgi:bis(5'-adenosyl)-triphosphatase
MECPFCEDSVIKAVFAESQNFMAVYNLAPVLPGHSIVIPKDHLTSILDLPDNMLSEMMAFSRKVTMLLLKVFDAEAFDWSVQDKEAAGQTVAHLHMHIVPRTDGDLKSPGDWYPEIRKSSKEFLDSGRRQKLSDDELERIVQKLRSEGEKYEF